MKADIIEDLSTGTSQSKRIAQAMQRGDIGVNILGDEMFEKAYRYREGGDDVEDVVAFAYGRRVYFRKGSSSIFSDAVHEGTHALDDLNNLRWDAHLWEKRAYFYEYTFQLWKGRPREFGNLVEILDHIKKYY
jgi:hypothetical protein